MLGERKNYGWAQMTADGTEPKRRGRPALPADEKKRITMTFRVREVTRDELAEAAEKNGRSISEEIEYRLVNYNNGFLFAEEMLRRRISSVVDEKWTEGNRAVAAEFIKGVLEKKYQNIVHATEILKGDLNSLIDVFEEFGLKVDSEKPGA